MDRRIEKWYRPKWVKLALNLWPPFWGAGIRIVSISEDFTCVKVRLKFRWWNKNVNRSQYGGSIFSMTDPIYTSMLIGILREEYYVWDKEASIDFISPGLSYLEAEFIISQSVVDDIVRQTATGEKCFPEFTTHITDSQGKIVATIQRKLYVRKKRKYREKPLSDNEEISTSQ
ncbi:DUF4442 domain-containing protein [Vibrio hippocampi]|uniref:DUF4442 domain-containing protein n=1 Tax=Vibrio hippocampi TaxID=654686 RepID=A0ABM8ZEU9_9VIBR|nr:DUF4442 domain-containing protein [Vibrio hippocampi]CAH0525040.1 hypothetical protein VHP8226_00705 [Vibrio hippocampi]